MNYLLCLLLVPGIIFSSCITVQADTRNDAVSLLTALRQDSSAGQFPDELRSLDAAVATAEMYHHLGDQKNAERYYKLAIQKGNLLQQQLKQTAPVPPTAAVQEPVSSSGKQSTPAPTPAPAPTLVADQETEYQSARLVGASGTYTVAKGDTIRMVAAKLGVSRAQLAAMNGLDSKAPLKTGQILKYNNRRIIPEHRIKDGIVINIPDRMLYFFQQGSMTYSTAVALGTPTKMDNIPWHTPTGKFRIVNKAKDPTWTVPPSIQEEMRREGKEVITSIPPGPTNPLGKYAMKTSLPGILIHSTTKPWSIYTYASHGCIRVYPDRMEELFKLVKLNAPGEIIYRPVKLAVTDDGKILLEAHSDIYNKTKGLEAEAKALIRAHKLDDKVDWEKVKQVVSRKAGVAEEVTRSCDNGQETVKLNRSQSPS